LAKALSLGRRVSRATAKALAGGCRACATLGRIGESGLSLDAPPSLDSESTPVTPRDIFRVALAVSTIVLLSRPCVTIHTFSVISLICEPSIAILMVLRNKFV